MVAPPGYVIAALRIDASEAARTAQKALKRATVTSYASMTKAVMVTPVCTGCALSASAWPIVKVPLAISTRPQPATNGVQLCWTFNLQVPLTQDRPDAQTLPHVPQWLQSVARFTHAPVHSVVPVGHDVPHAPPAQVALPPIGDRHGIHDVPHEFTAVSDTQLPPQGCIPAAQAQAPEASQTPFLGDVQAPDLRGDAEHTALPEVQTTVPDVAQPPLPGDMHPTPSATQLAPHRVVPAVTSLQTVGDTIGELIAHI